ncbi:MAG: TolC family protein [Bacteriovoracia bacterium]
MPKSIFLSLIVLTSILMPLPCIAQSEYEPPDTSVALYLRNAIEEGLRKNFGARLRDYRRAKLEINWADAYEKFWYPSMAFKIDYGNQKIDRLKTISDPGGYSVTSSEIPQGYAGFTLGQYTLFNWGRDYMRYLNQKKEFKQGKENLTYEQRELKFQIIGQYFSLARAKNILDIYQEQLRQATFIYRLAREKANLKQISKQYYLEAREEFLRAQGEYHRAKNFVTTEEQQMAQILGDSEKNNYKIMEVLQFQKLNIHLNEAVRVAYKNNQDIYNSVVNLEKAQLDYKLARKENLPLPKFSVDLGTYKQLLGPNEHGTAFETHNGNSNVEIVASLNMTWPIFGKGGLFNKRKLESSFIEKQMAQVSLNHHRKDTRIVIEAIYKQIRVLERQVEVSKLRKENAKKTVDTTLDNYLKKKALTVELSKQLVNFVQASLKYEDNKLEHLLRKLQLAKLMGVDDLPRNSFDNLGVDKAAL